MTVADVALDMSVLYDMEFPTPCAHSGHNRFGGRHHGGDAEWVICAVHLCPGETECVTYPACQPWKDYVDYMQDKTWLCTCGWAGAGSEMCIVLYRLDDK